MKGLVLRSTLSAAARVGIAPDGTQDRSLRLQRRSLAWGYVVAAACATSSYHTMRGSSAVGSRLASAPSAPACGMSFSHWEGRAQRGVRVTLSDPGTARG